MMLGGNAIGDAMNIMLKSLATEIFICLLATTLLAANSAA